MAIDKEYKVYTAEDKRNYILLRKLDDIFTKFEELVEVDKQKINLFRHLIKIMGDISENIKEIKNTMPAN